MLQLHYVEDDESGGVDGHLPDFLKINHASIKSYIAVTSVVQLHEVEVDVPAEEEFYQAGDEAPRRRLMLISLTIKREPYGVPKQVLLLYPMENIASAHIIRTNLCPRSFYWLFFIFHFE